MNSDLNESSSLTKLLGISMKTKSLTIFFVILATACNFSFGAGYSMNDENYFMEPPHIEMKSNKYFLSWRYGKLGFYFEPSCKTQDGMLLCSLQGTSSSSSLTGQTGYIEITQKRSIKAIKAGSVYWLQPDGSKIKLVVGSA